MPLVDVVRTGLRNQSARINSKKKPSRASDVIRVRCTCGDHGLVQYVSNAGGGMRLPVIVHWNVARAREVEQV